MITNSFRRYRGRELGRCIALSMMSVAAVCAAIYYVFPAIGLEARLSLFEFAIVCAIAAGPLVALVWIFPARVRAFSCVDWSSATVSGFAVTVLIYCGLLSARNALGFQPMGRAAVIAASRAAPQGDHMPIAKLNPSDSSPTDGARPGRNLPIVAYLLSVFLDYGWFQPASVACFCIASAALILKLRQLRREGFAHRDLLTKLLEWPGEPFTVDKAGALLRTLRQKSDVQGLRGSALVRRIERMLERVDNTKSSAGVDTLMNSLSDIDAEASSASFGGIAFLVYLMPAIAFLGTVYGVGQAIYGFSSVLPKAQDFASVNPELIKITSNLGVSFNVTMLGLVLSSLAGLGMTIIRHSEERLLGEVDLDCVEMFRSLAHEDPGAKRIVEAVEKLGVANVRDALREEFESLCRHIQQFREAVKGASDQFHGLARETTTSNAETKSATEALNAASREFVTCVNGLTGKFDSVGQDVSRSFQNAATSFAKGSEELLTESSKSVDHIEKALQEKVEAVGGQVLASHEALLARMESHIGNHVAAARQIAGALQDVGTNLLPGRQLAAGLSRPEAASGAAGDLAHGKEKGQKPGTAPLGRFWGRWFGSAGRSNGPAA